ncbi:MAG: hypothetical protein COT18_02970, partial [Elusimicrobia bacterium CG08_land_8_20_14_0_20_59_10]
PAQVILIRHAEKPKAGPELNERGFKRAQALVKFFKSEPAVSRYGAPAVIYAAAPKNENSSLRSIQTVTPLARALGLGINDSFTRGQTNKLVRDIMENPAYDGRMVLVCWQHVKLVEAAQALAKYNNSPPTVYAAIPMLWPDQAFDRAWILDLSAGKVVSFKNLPQRLLPGDSSR